MRRTRQIKNIQVRPMHIPITKMETDALLNGEALTEMPLIGVLPTQESKDAFKSIADVCLFSKRENIGNGILNAIKPVNPEDDCC